MCRCVVLRLNEGHLLAGHSPFSHSDMRETGGKLVLLLFQTDAIRGPLPKSCVANLLRLCPGSVNPDDIHNRCHGLGLEPNTAVVVCDGNTTASHTLHLHYCSAQTSAEACNVLAASRTQLP